ncbi:hypothetical protein ABOONEI_2543, partial [Aciduliprofundum boonei T469]
MCRRFGFGSNALLVTGQKSYEVAGKRVKEILEDSGFNVDVILTSAATMENLDRIKDGAKGMSFLVGVGGGSKIDLAKKASYDLGIPFISVPTIATHDGIASPRATIKNGGGS